MGQRAEGDRGPWLPVTPSLLVTSGSRLLLGRDVVVNRWFSLSCYEAVAIGDRVRIGERVSIHDENHDTTSDVRRARLPH